MAVARPLDVHHELRNACRNGRWTRVQRMLDAGADPTLSNPHHENALHHLARRSCADDHLATWAHRLLDQGVDVNALNQDTHSALMLALNQGHEALAVALLQRGADPNLGGDVLDHHRTLARTVAMGMLHAVEALLVAGVDLHRSAPDGQTLMHRIAAHPMPLAMVPAGPRAVQAVNRVLDQGARWDRPDHAERLPLMLAVQQHHTPVALLLERGALTRLDDAQRRALLHATVEAENRPALVVLLQHGLADRFTPEDHRALLDIAHQRGDEVLVLVERLALRQTLPSGAVGHAGRIRL